MFQSAEKKQKNEFIDKAKRERDDRAGDKKKDLCAVKIQAHVRGFIARCRVKREIRLEIDGFLDIPMQTDMDYKPKLRPAAELFKQVNKFLLVFHQKDDRKRFEYLCKYILASMNASTMKPMYVSLALNKQYVVPWIHQIKQLLYQCCAYFNVLKPEFVDEMRLVSTCLALLVTFTSPKAWKLFSLQPVESIQGNQFNSYVLLCNNIMGHLNTKGLYPHLKTLLLKGLGRSKPCFKAPTLTAIITLATRPLLASDFSQNLLNVFLLHILSVPAVIHHLGVLATDCKVMLMKHRLFSRSIDLLHNEQSADVIFNALEGNYALCLLGNLIELGHSEMEGIVENTERFMVVVTRLLLSCKAYVDNKKSHMTHWHPVLGWFSQKLDQGYHDTMPFVVKQLQLLWKHKMMTIIFEPLLTYHELRVSFEAKKSKDADRNSKNILKKALDKASSSKQSAPKLKLDSALLVSTCKACTMYMTAMNTLTQLSMDIMGGLCYKDVMLQSLWKLITELGPGCGLKTFLDALSIKPVTHSHSILDLLQLTCDTTSHIISILDDIELYEQNKPLELHRLVEVAFFLNNFVFKSIWNGLIDVEKARSNEVFNSVHSLLMLLYERDCRTQFTPKDHWLIKDVKPSAFLAELEKGRKTAQYLLQIVPHIIPHKERVVLFRRTVEREKESLGFNESTRISPHSTFIRIHRSRIVEDGYRQLAALPANALKGLIRVKFVNEQGLDEAGIDQDGVFKEFLEETVQRVFDPDMNLFKITEDQKLYPSNTSFIQDDHLALYEFIGGMLAKAVYEGIVIEVPFAPFFLSQIRGHHHSAIYSAMDELPSLDRDLYKSLTYVKHYEGDISDLDLTFSTDEDVLGRLVTHELRPGGRLTPVTDDNKIAYIHLMAHFKLRTQIKNQTAAFLRGFKSIISKDWLSMFSGPELQKLISGDTADIDFSELRRHTQYYGGFHNSHKVINWLWDVLQHDFNAQERGAFLKFVTSCSKAPLLGFTHLEPPFSIRCVEVSEDQDTGDTIGSVIKGFLNIRRRDPVGRLPTSSTCFNLLKLPNYQKKATLRDKLRYAILSNTGFELS